MASGNLPPATLMRIVRELKGLAGSPPEGVTLVPHETMGEVVVDIAGPEDTPYFGGSFRVKLVLGAEYPATPPKGYFLTKIFHPNISDAGDICVNTLKRDWKSSNSLTHVLAVIRCLLIVPFPESSLNDDAGKLFMDSYADYSRKAALLTTIHAMKGGVAGGPAAAGGGSSAPSALPAQAGEVATIPLGASATAASSSVEALPEVGSGGVGAPAAPPAHGGALLESAPKRAKRSHGGSTAKKASSKSKKKKGLKRL